MKLRYDELLSNVAFSFNLRRSNEARRIAVNEVGCCTLTVSKPVLKAKRLWFQRLKLQCDEPLSNSAFNFNLRRHNEGALLTAARLTFDQWSQRALFKAAVALCAQLAQVGRCRSTPGCPCVDRAWFQRLKLKLINLYQTFLSISSCGATHGTGPTFLHCTS